MSSNCILIDYAKKVLDFPDHVCVDLISAKQAQTSLKNEASCFMILSFLEVKGDIDFKLIDITREFMEVFLEEVPGLPPQREIKFAINMVLGVGPVSITHNKIAPLELVELNK